MLPRSWEYLELKNGMKHVLPTEKLELKKGRLFLTVPKMMKQFLNRSLRQILQQKHLIYLQNLNLILLKQHLHA